MASLLFWIVGSTVVVSLISLIGIATLAIKDQLLKQILLILVGFSAGALMGGSFLHLLPEALESSIIMNVFWYLIIGFAFFFMMERLLRWRHCHEGRCAVHSFTYLNLLGDGIHNFVDGLVIAASFMFAVDVGIVTTFAVIAHEIPQELGDFGVLVYGGFTKFKALLYNLLDALTAIFGGLVGFFLFPFIHGFASFLVPFAAGGFIYIAASDLIPELHKEADTKRAWFSFIFFLIGIAFMGTLRLIFAE
jgi:zinc and cadmium transporter